VPLPTAIRVSARTAPAPLCDLKARMAPTAWIDSGHQAPIYVNRRHETAHFRRIAETCAPRPGGGR